MAGFFVGDPVVKPGQRFAMMSDGQEILPRLLRLEMEKSFRVRRDFSFFFIRRAERGLDAAQRLAAKVSAHFTRLAGGHEVEREQWLGRVHAVGLPAGVEVRLASAAHGEGGLGAGGVGRRRAGNQEMVGFLRCFDGNRRIGGEDEGDGRRQIVKVAGGFFKVVARLGKTNHKLAVFRLNPYGMGKGGIDRAQGQRTQGQSELSDHRQVVERF